MLLILAMVAMPMLAASLLALREKELRPLGVGGMVLILATVLFVLVVRG